MKLLHTSPSQITKIQDFYIHNEFQGALFFSQDLYFTTVQGFIYSIDVDDSQIITAWDLEYNQDIIDEIKDRFDTYFDCNIDDDEAMDYLCEDLTIWECEQAQENWEARADFSWFLQGIQAKAAKAQGALCFQSEDEQGTVYIINMINKEHLLIDVTSSMLEQ